MEAPKEIFLKDYKKPDYYFDTVCAFIFLPFRVCACMRTCKHMLDSLLSVIKLLILPAGGFEIFIG